MNLATYSPVMILLYVFALLWITMDLHFQDLTPVQRRLVPLLVVLLSAVNQMIRTFASVGLLGRLIPLTMHLPYFLLFLYLTKCGVIKMTFMIFTAMVFSAPIALATTYCKQFIPLDSPLMLLSNLAVYFVMLLAIRFIFRDGFRYLLKYGDNKLISLFCLVPLLYYVYTIAVANVDLSGMTSLSWVVIRSLPILNVYVFYFLLLHNYRELSLRRELELAQAALGQELDAAREQISLLNQVQTQSTLYRHDMRHHLTAIDGFLALDKPQQAREYIKKVHSDIDAITPKRFCENELVNLLCAAFSDRAARTGIRFSAQASMPEVLPLSETELCTLISNGLENALNAAAETEDKWVEFYCCLQANMLLLEIKNPYCGEVALRNGLPVSGRHGHGYGYGCYSIQSIAERLQGLCAFRPEDGRFTLHIALPLRQC